MEERIQSSHYENAPNPNVNLLRCDTDVDLNHGKIARIENLDHLTQVETISLRWNLIKKIENLNSPR